MSLARRDTLRLDQFSGVKQRESQPEDTKTSAQPEDEPKGIKADAKAGKCPVFDEKTDDVDEHFKRHIYTRSCPSYSSKLQQQATAASYRSKLQKQAKEGHITNEEHAEKVKGTVAKHKLRNKRSSLRVLQFTQQHGDIVSQKGVGMQDYYGHEINQLRSLVRDSSKLRFITDDHKATRESGGRKRQLERGDPDGTNRQPSRTRDKA
ncbi:hypothetical protein F4779DRAFT_636099 [Xylariaceae sp. FL0662B]|nr:hypothetical protein F4779DRAFT_636099 [Xylariaceae sp. FL0662B]